MIHGCMNDYSRKIMILKCNTDNQAATVLNDFLQAGDNHGLPSWVHGDQGGENVAFAQCIYSAILSEAQTEVLLSLAKVFTIKVGGRICLLPLNLMLLVQRP